MHSIKNDSNLHSDVQIKKEPIINNNKSSVFSKILKYIIKIFKIFILLNIVLPILILIWPSILAHVAFQNFGMFIFNII